MATVKCKFDIFESCSKLPRFWQFHNLSVDFWAY